MERTMTFSALKRIKQKKSALISLSEFYDVIIDSSVMLKREVFFYLPFNFDIFERTQSSSFSSCQNTAMKGTFWNESDQTFQLTEMTLYFVDVICWRLIYFGFWTGIFMVAFILHIFLIDPDKRKKSIYRLHLIILPLTILFNINQIVFWYLSFRLTWYKPGGTYSSKITVNYFVILNELLIHFVPLLAESTLLLQIASFFPRPLYSILFRFGVLAPFAVLLISRLGLSIANANLIIRAWNSNHEYSNSPFPVITFTHWLDKARIFALTEYALGMIYCIMASSFLLYKAYNFVHSSKITFLPPIKRKLRFLTEAIFMCFLPPAALTIAGLTTRIQPSLSMGKPLYQQQNTTSILVNVSVLCALLATSWSSVRTFADEKIASHRSVHDESEAIVNEIPLAVKNDNESSSTNNHQYNTNTNTNFSVMRQG